VGLEPERCDDPGGVGTCWGNEEADAVAGAGRTLLAVVAVVADEGPPRRERRALCLSAAMVVEAEAEDGSGSSEVSGAEPP
jgi:hypothetical protein